MTRQRYSVKEALNRVVSIFKGTVPNTDQPNTVQGQILSEDEALSDLTELFASSLPNENLTFPFAVIWKPVSTIPSGTYSHLGGVLWCDTGGALKYIGSSGTITTLAGS